MRSNSSRHGRRPAVLVALAVAMSVVLVWANTASAEPVNVITVPAPKLNEPNHVITCIVNTITPFTEIYLKVVTVQAISTVTCDDTPEATSLTGCLAWNPRTAAPNDPTWLLIKSTCDTVSQSPARPRRDLNAFPTGLCARDGYYRSAATAKAWHNDYLGSLDGFYYSPSSDYIDCPGVPVQGT